MGKRERILVGASRVFNAIVVVMLLLFVSSVVRDEGTVAIWKGIAASAACIAALALGGLRNRVAQDRIAKMSRIVRQVQLIPTQPEGCPWLDRDRLHALTTEVEDAGFQLLGDYSVGYEGEPVEDVHLPESFTRVMVDDKRRVFAEISQSVRGGSELTQMICTFATFFTSGDQCRTIGGKDPGSALQLLPQQQLQLSFSSEPGAAVDELLERHLDRRAKLSEERGLTVVDDTSIETYRQHIDEMLRRMCAWASRLMHGIGAGVV